MLSHKDNTAGIVGRSTERMNFRTKPHIKQTIQQAAALAGVDDSVFTMSAAFQSAMATIEAHERTQLQPVDHIAFFDALDNPSAPTDALRDAAKQYSSKVRAT